MLDPEYGASLLPLSEQMPIWVVDTPANRVAAEQARMISPARDVTTFRVDLAETREAWCTGVLFVVAEHYGDFAGATGNVRIVGVEPSLVVRAELSLLGLDNISPAPDGFLAQREEPMTLPRARELWYSGQPITGLAFGLNDAVEVCGGAEAGAGGAVISLEAMDPEPQYLIEVGDGQDRVIPQSWLRRAGEPGAAADAPRR